MARRSLRLGAGAGELVGLQCVDAVEAEARWGLAVGWRLDGAARRRGGVAAAGPAEERRCRRRIPAIDGAVGSLSGLAHRPAEQGGG